MRRRLAALAAVASIGAALPAATPLTPAAIGKSCSSGYTHAVIKGAHKCLRRGQYCARAADRQYHRYGFHCHKRDRNGDYHLT